MSPEVIAFLVLTIALLVFWYATKEDFTSQNEKASVIYDWFMANGDPKYSQYKRDLPKSNVVEFEAIMKLQKDGGLSVKQIEEIL